MRWLLARLSRILMREIAVNYSPDSFSHRRTPEIEKQPERAIGEPQVGQQLALVNRRQAVQRFDFDDHKTFNDQISAVGAVDVHAAIYQRKCLLRLDAQSRRMQLQAQHPKYAFSSRPGPMARVDADR